MQNVLAVAVLVRNWLIICFLLWSADIISTVEFDSTGNYLATGDKGGRVVLFERNEMVCNLSMSPMTVVKHPVTKTMHHHRLKFVIHTYSNCSPFLFRKKVVNTNSTPNSNRMSRNLITWNPLKSKKRLTRSNGANDRTRRISYYQRMVLCSLASFTPLLTCLSDKTIKLWKVFEKSLRVVSESNHFDGQRAVPPPNQQSLLRLPRTTQQDNIIAAVPRKVYSNAHAYHIHSISVNSDQETYISADDLRINLWNLNISDQSFSEDLPSRKCVMTKLPPPDIVDIKPVNMEELTEVITATEFHPTHCNLFMYSSSKSNIKLADMRESALCDKSAKCECSTLSRCIYRSSRLFKGFEEEEDPTTRSFFSEIISSISDVKFSHDGRYILSRDYLSLKIWDINMDSRPVKTIPIHDHLRGKLCDLYENDCIFDKFECMWAGDDKWVFHCGNDRRYTTASSNTITKSRYWHSNPIAGTSWRDRIIITSGYSMLTHCKTSCCRPINLRLRQRNLEDR